MTSKEPKEPGEGQSGKRPRGMGGVILILALLMALFVVVSNNSNNSQSSLHAFHSHLLNGRVQKFTYSGGVVTAEVSLDEKDKDAVQPIEVVYADFWRSGDHELCSKLQSQRLDRDLYGGTGSTSRFLQDLEGDKIRVLDSFLVQEVAGKSPVTNTEDPRKAGNYLTALLLVESSVRYVRIDAPTSSSEPSLQALGDALAKKNAPMQVFSLSLSPTDFKISEPNTAMLYIVGTIGPWILVLLIVWFFIIRQMRSPGGSGGVLSFGRSRASLYT